jgi:hypothetical protein
MKHVMSDLEMLVHAASLLTVPSATASIEINAQNALVMALNGAGIDAQLWQLDGSLKYPGWGHTLSSIEMFIELDGQVFSFARPQNARRSPAVAQRQIADFLSTTVPKETGKQDGLGFQL